jgi:hypothetical protein
MRMINLLPGLTCGDEIAAEAAFAKSHPAYATTSVIDTLRASQYSRLDANAHTYLDYTGAGVYAQSQVEAHTEFLARSIVGNPHSGNLASRAMTAWVRRGRRRVLEYFRASPDEYEVISRRMPLARSSRSLSPIHSALVVGICSPPTITTQSTASVSLPDTAAPTSSTPQ